MILDKRERDKNYGIVITSNLNLSDLALRMNDKITSRIAGMCDIVKIEDKDWRLKK